MNERDAVSMLPEVGSAGRDQLEAEAVRFALGRLHRSGDGLLEALYETYQHYRLRFIGERGLMDVAPGSSPAWTVALADARELEAHVRQTWAETILARLADA